MNEVAKNGGGELSEAEKLAEKVAIAKRLIEAQTADVLKRKKDFEVRSGTLNGAKVTGVLRSSGRVRLVEPRAKTKAAEEPKEEPKAKQAAEEAIEEIIAEAKEEPKAEKKTDGCEGAEERDAKRRTAGN
jgi:hypothetical protein